MKFINLDKLERIVDGLYDKIKSIFATKVEVQNGLDTKANEEHDHDSISGNAGSATKLQNSIKIGEKDFDGTTDISVPDIIGYIITTTSGSEYINKWTKFATINVSHGPYTECSGQFLFNSIEANQLAGILYFYIRTGSAVASTSIYLDWLTITNANYKASISAVKTSDGVYDLYFQPIHNWMTMSITCFCHKRSRIQLYSGQPYVDTITAESTSKLNSAVSHASRLLDDNIGNATTPVYFANGVPVAGTPYSPIKRSINFGYDHTTNWDSSPVMSGLTYAGGWHGKVDSDGYLSFGNSGSYKLHMIIDGDYYAQETKKVSLEGHTHNFLNIKGNNTISSTANDTTANWAKQSNSVHWYSATNQITSQPSQHAFLLNLVSGQDIHQMWFQQQSGDLYHRGGNSNGWGCTWRPILDTNNFATRTKITTNGKALTINSSAPGTKNTGDIWIQI